MLTKVVKHLGRNVVAYAALAIALGGTSYAAVGLPRNSVGPLQLKDGAVTPKKLAKNAVSTLKVQNGSLLALDFKKGQLPRGATGPAGPAGAAGSAGATGPTGPTGPAGPGARWALVDKDGTILASSAGATITVLAVHFYYVNLGASLTGKTIQATPAYTNSDPLLRGSLIVALCGGAPPQGVACSASNNDSTVFVNTANADGTGAAHAFYVAAF